MSYIGIDISKLTFVVAYSSAKDIATRTFENSAKGVLEFIKTITPQESHCILEATGNYGMLLVYLLTKAGIVVSMENPLKIKNFARVMLTTVKTDEVDARLIALYGEKMQPAPFKLRSESLMMLKQKRTVLRQLKKQLTACKNMEESLSVLPFVDATSKKVVSKTIKFLEKQISEMEEEVCSVATIEYEKQMKLLTSIKGIGATLAVALIVATGGFTYFSNAKQLTRYLGLCPTYQQSGTSVHTRGHINRNGDSHLRSQLYIAACASLRCNTECKAFYERLRKNGKPGKLAVTAVANKLVRQAFAVVTQEKAYVDGHVSAEPKNTPCSGNASRQGAEQSAPTSENEVPAA